MPFPPAIFDLARRPAFWSRFFFETWGEGFPKLEGCQLRFPVGPAYALVLHLDPALGYFGLDLQQPGSAEPIEIAWDDQAHWHPHVLRWEELDLVCRCVALADPDLPHPGLPLVLLHRFAPICVGNRPEVIHPLIHEACQTVGAFSPAQVTEMVHRYDRRQDGFVWRQSEPHGWYPAQDAVDARAGLYSTRRPDNPEFPFDGLTAMFAAAHRHLAAVADPRWLAGEAGAVARGVAGSGDLSGLPVLADALEEAGCERGVILGSLRAAEFPVRGCWVVETLLGLEPGEVIARALGHSRRPDRVVYRFAMDIPTREAGGRFNRELLAIPKALDAALRTAGLGRAEMSGGQSRLDTPIGEYDAISVTATINDERDRGLAVMRDVLTRANAPRQVVIRLTAPEAARFPLVPGGPV
jgi:hypothetical protein